MNHFATPFRPFLVRRAAALATFGGLVLAALASPPVRAAADEPVAAPPAPAIVRGQALAEPPPTATYTAAPLSVEEVLHRNAEARGGLSEWHKIKTIVEIGRIERTNEVPGAVARKSRAANLAPQAPQVVEFRLDLARPNKMRLDLTYQGATAIQAFDGKEGYIVQPGPTGAVARPYTEAQARAAAEQQDLEGPLLGATGKGTKVTLDGVEAVRGQPAYKLRLETKDGATRHVWVDAKNYFDVKIDGTRQIGERSWPVETFFDDFRPVGKVIMPHLTETAVAGVNTMERMRVVKVALNRPLDASRFTLPKAPTPAASPTQPPGPPAAAGTAPPKTHTP
jgi:hypothetical protein